MGLYNKSATVVKLAVIGDVLDTPNNLIVLPDQIASFEYTLLGKDAYMFKIELVNYDEVFLSSITKAINKVIKSSKASDYTSLAADRSELQSMPKLLIQWGYEDLNGVEKLSAIHSAAVTTVDYKFSQGKEKILIIKAVFVPEDATGEENPEAGATYSSKILVDVDMPFVTSARTPPELFINRSGTQDHMSLEDIIHESLRQFLLQIDGFELSSLTYDFERRMDIINLQQALAYSFDLDDLERVKAYDEGTGSYWDAVQAGISMRFDQEGGFRNEKINTMSDHTYDLHVGRGQSEDDARFRQRHKFIKAAVEDTDSEKIYWDKLESILKFIGLNIKRRDTKEIFSEIVLRGNNQTAGKVDNRIVGDYHPTDIDTRTLKATNDTPSNETLWTAQSDSIHLDFPLDENCGGAAYDDISNKLYGGNPPAEFSIQIYNFNKDIIDTIQTAGSVQYPKGGTTITISGDTLIPRINPNDMLGPPIYVTLREMVISLTANITKAVQDNSKLDDIRNEEYVDWSNVIPTTHSAEKFNNVVAFTKLSPKERRDYVNSKIEITCVSQEDESVFATINRVIAAYNSFVDGEWSRGENNQDESYGTHMDMLIEGKTWLNEDFNTVLEREASDPKSTRTTSVHLGAGYRIQAMRKSLMERSSIESSDLKFPIESVHPDALNKISVDASGSIANIINLTYGFSDSIVKFFDFKGDLRWFRNASIAAVNTHHLANVYSHLQANQIRKGFVPLAEFLLEDKDFIKAANAHGVKVNNDGEDLDVGEYDKPQDVLKKLVETVKSPSSLKSTGKERTPPIEDLTHLKFISDYVDNKISNADLEGSIGTDIESSLSTFHLFLESMMQKESLALLMDIDTDTNGTRYYLRDHNMYDDRAANHESHALNTATQQYASNLDMVTELRIKTLGIPEVSRLVDITHRAVYLTVADPSESNPTRNHWLTGLYRIISLNHLISPTEGYSSEFKLIKITN